MKWQLEPKAPNSFFKQFPEYSPLIVQLLYNRGLKTQQQIDEFFNPDFQEDFHSPFLLKGMEKAVKHILKAISKQEKIVIYGDYDADGVCAAAILFLTLQALTAENLNVYIPNRDKEGHGLNKEAVKNLAQKGTNLIITVDCASSDLEEVDLANSLGLDIIITDHHLLGNNLPKAIALLNPWQKRDKYPFKELAGATVAYKLAWALLERTASGKTKDSSRKTLQKWLLDLVAIATVADVMPIIGENRTLVKYGLSVLAQTKWLGLQELMKVAQVTPQLTQPSLSGEAPTTNLSTSTLGYILGPRLNAAGRMDHANKAWQLLVTQDKEEAEKLAQQLNQNNLARQKLTVKIVQEVEGRLENKFSQSAKPKLIFEGSPDWPVGIIGLVAGKIAEKYRRPTIIYQEKEKTIYASGRTIPQFNLIETIKKCADFLDDFGGHKGAAGFQMKKENLEQVKKIFNQIAEEKLKDKDLVPILDIDTELSLEEINWPNYEQIQLFAPFGRANPEPKFLVKGLEINDLRLVGNNGRHLKAELVMFNNQSSGGKTFKAIGFNLGKWAKELKKGDLVDVVFEFIADDWNGYRDLQMKIVDLKLTESSR
jgi:single-stranded-DNA-specific exonuclease